MSHSEQIWKSHAHEARHLQKIMATFDVTVSNDKAVDQVVQMGEVAARSNVLATLDAHALAERRQQMDDFLKTSPNATREEASLNSRLAKTGMGFDQLITDWSEGARAHAMAVML